MLRLAFDFIITWRETRTRPNAYAVFLFWHTYQRNQLFDKRNEKSLFSTRSSYLLLDIHILPGKDFNECQLLQ